MTKKQEYLIIAGLLVLIFPFFALLFYMHPQGDDFFFAYKMQSQGVFSFVKEMYFTWSGRYFSMFLGAIDPWVFESLIGLRISLTLFQLLTVASVFLLVKSTLVSRISSIRILVISLVFYLIYINTIVSVFEFSFWYPAASAYQLSIALISIFLSIQLFYYNNRLGKIAFILLSSFLLFITIGLLELTIVPLLIITTTNVLVYLKQKQKLRLAILLLIITISFTLLMILAPGNYVRHAIIGSQIDFTQAFMFSVETFILIVGYLFKDPTVILTSILFITLVFSISKSNKQVFSFKLPFIKPWIIIVFSILSILSILFPSILILKHLPPSRVLNFISYFVLVLWIFDIILIINYYSTRFSFAVSNNIQRLLIVTIIMSIFSGVGVLNKNEFAHGNYRTVYFNGNIVKAYYILSFEAKKYDIHMKKRDAIIRNARKNGKTGIQIYPFKHNTSLINFINLNETNYSFNWEAKYYNLDSIYIEPRKKQSP